MKHTLNWIEIFVTDLARAQRFYEQILGIQMRPEEGDGPPMVIFPYEMEGAERPVGGALVKHPTRRPAAHGSLPYLNCNGVLDQVLARIEKAGGKILQPRTDIGPPGFIALVEDTEGNTIGLHTERT